MNIDRPKSWRMLTTSTLPAETCLNLKMLKDLTNSAKNVALKYVNVNETKCMISKGSKRQKRTSKQANEILKKILKSEPGEN